MVESKEYFELIMKELKEIKKELSYIKEHMIDVDSILTVEEERLVEEAEKEFNEGKTIRLDDVKREFI